MAIFVKINTYGVIFTIIIITFVISTGIYALNVSQYEIVGFEDNIGQVIVPDLTTDT